MINTKSPADFIPNFTNERLTILADALLEQCYETDEDLQSMYDSNYSVGCTRFDRQKNKLLDMPLEHDWLSTIDSSNRLVMSIYGAPFRFTNDNHILPKKKASVLMSETENLQMSKFSNDSNQLSIPLIDPLSKQPDSDHPLKWRFFIDVIESGEMDDREYEIYFVGLNNIDRPCCTWKYSEHISSHLFTTDNYKPQKVKTNSAKITLPDIQERKKNNE